MTSTYLTTREMADVLRLKPETLREYVRDGIIPAIRLRQRVIRFDRETVEAALLARATRSECGAAR